MRQVAAVVLVFLMVLGPGFGDLVAQTTEQRKVEERQVPPKPGEGKNIYVPGVRPFLWINHGGDPYFPCPDRASLVSGFARLGSSRVMRDLQEQGLTEDQARYVWAEFSRGTDSKVTETVFSVDTPLERMRFGHGVRAMVVVKGRAESAWQLILPLELGSGVVYLPKICCNISVSPFKAQTEKTELIVRTMTEVREKKILVPVSFPEYQDRNVFKTLPAAPDPPNPSASKKRWWIIPVLVGVGVGIFVATRSGGSKPASDEDKIDLGGCGQPGRPPCP
ncbi:MAG: hypothetical protein HY454_02455 [Parcubacteria group bacterium]|nr:hypothetical protein [Parcubacteria group bacterium]